LLIQAEVRDQGLIISFIGLLNSFSLSLLPSNALKDFDRIYFSLELIIGFEILHFYFLNLYDLFESNLQGLRRIQEILVQSITQFKQRKPNTN